MLNPYLRMSLVRVLAAAALAAQPSTVAAQGLDAEAAHTVVPVLPARRSSTPLPSAPPDLLPGAELVRPMTLHVAIRQTAPGGSPATVHQTIMRTADRVHIAAVAGREWLFERNVRDARRAFGSLIDHRSRVIVLYDESDLRNLLGIGGWGRVLALGFDPDRLATLEHSGRTRRVGGLSFARYASPGKDGAAEEVWWSMEHLFPTRFVTADGRGSTIFAVERIQPGVDTALLRAPAVRFPTFQVVNLAEWLEGPH